MNFNRLQLIIKREFMAIVAKKSFIILTLLTPFLILLIGAIPALLMSINDNDEAKKVAIIDESGTLQEPIQDSNDFHFVMVPAAESTHIREFYNDRADSLYAVVLIPENVLTNQRVYIYSESTVSSSLERCIDSGLEPLLRSAKIAQYNMSDLAKIIEDCQINLHVKNVKWSDNGSESVSSTEVSLIIGMLLALITYMFVLSYGSMIMNSVVEEKTNRIVEVIISCCKPMELMMGKIVGVALVGLLQIAIWSALLGILGSILGISAGAMGFSADANAQLAAGAQAIPDSDFSNIMKMILSVNYTKILSMFVLYFIGGYLLYASLFAALGSAVDQASDASQFMMPVMLVIIVALYAGMACIENPDGQVAFWFSMVPFTSPIVMMVRLPYEVPVWEMILSVALLYITALATVWVSARIFRRGILLYGKKQTYKDLFHWIRKA